MGFGHANWLESLAMNNHDIIIELQAVSAETIYTKKKGGGLNGLF
jgi:hypothetical protein